MPEEHNGHFPLRGLRVVECGDLIAAPYAGRLLADAGADVVKIEPYGEDSARWRGPYPDDRPHPESDTTREGEQVLFRLLGVRALALSTHGPLVYPHAPGLGADNEYVFRELLGLSAADIQEHEAERVIY